MKLTYRGISYEYNPTIVETNLGQIGGKYRGLDWRFRNLKKPPMLIPTVDLKYRGVNYNQPGTVVTGKVAQTNPTISTQEKARALMRNHSQDLKKRQQVLLSRLTAEIN